MFIIIYIKLNIASQGGLPMLHIKSLDEGLDIFKALGSDIRVEIIKLLLHNNGLNMNEIATELNITNGALTSHIKSLRIVDLLQFQVNPSGHGNQKKCSVHLDKILIDLDQMEDSKNLYQTELKVGHFSDYNVYPTCGLSSAKAIIGEVDDTRYFALTRIDIMQTSFGLQKDMLNTLYQILYLLP